MTTKRKRRLKHTYNLNRGYTMLLSLVPFSEDEVNINEEQPYP